MLFIHMYLFVVHHYLHVPAPKLFVNLNNLYYYYYLTSIYLFVFIISLDVHTTQRRRIMSKRKYAWHYNKFSLRQPIHIIFFFLCNIIILSRRRVLFTASICSVYNLTRGPHGHPYTSTPPLVADYRTSYWSR